MSNEDTEFASCPCNVCNEHLSFYDGTLRFDNLIPYFERFKSDNPGLNLSGKEPKVLFVNAAVRAYLRQFPSISLVSLQQSSKFNLEENPTQNQLNLEKVLKAMPQKEVGIILHDYCLPKDMLATGYPISLKEMDSREKASQFYNEFMRKKSWLNHKAWEILMNDLFGNHS